jgi:hypothetical protein
MCLQHRSARSSDGDDNGPLSCLCAAHGAIGVSHVWLRLDRQPMGGSGVLTDWRPWMAGRVKGQQGRDDGTRVMLLYHSCLWQAAAAQWGWVVLHACHQDGCWGRQTLGWVGARAGLCSGRRPCIFEFFFRTPIVVSSQTHSNHTASTALHCTALASLHWTEECQTALD